VDRSYITYVPCSDAKPETELSALAAVYKLCLDSRAKKEAATSPGSRPDDARKDQNAGTYSHCT
jgi:hypothetical protein